MAETFRVGILGAGRAGTAHVTVPHLPTLADGLRTQEIIAAARRSYSERRWVDLRKEFGMEGATEMS